MDLKITKDYEGLERIKNGDYVLDLDGDLKVEGNLTIDLDDRFVIRGNLIVSRSIIAAGCGIKAGEGIAAGCGIEAGEGIEAGWGIEAGCGIKAGEGIEAGWGIEAGEGIETKTFILSKKRIFAGISIYKTSTDCKKTICCAELREGEIAYGDLVIKKETVKLTLPEIKAKLGIDNLEIVTEEEEE